MQVSYNKGNSEASAVGTVAKDLLRLITDAYFSKKGLGHFIRIKTATNPSRHFIPKKEKKCKYSAVNGYKRCNFFSFFRRK